MKNITITYNRCPRCGQRWGGPEKYTVVRCTGCIMVHRIRTLNLWSRAPHQEEEMYLDTNWYDGILLWNITHSQCWYGTLNDIMAGNRHAIKLPMLPFTIKRAQLGKYLILL